MNSNSQLRKYGHYAGDFNIRAETFRQMLMEDFRFMEAARMQSQEYESASLSTDDLKLPRNVKDITLTNPQGLVNFASYSHKAVEQTDKHEKIIIHDNRTRRFMTRMVNFPPTDIWSRWLLNTKSFSAIMIMVILLNSIVLMIDEELPDDSDHKKYRFVLDILDFIFLTIFVSEILLKFLDNFADFWLESWNVFDFLVTTSSVIGVLLELFFEEASSSFGLIFAIIQKLRVFRIFRTLNVVTRWRRIQIIWDAVVNTIFSLLFIMILMSIFFYIFAIIGIQLFDRFTRSHRIDLDYHKAFSDLPRAMITLFQLFTLDHWYKLLQSLVTEMGVLAPIVYCLLWILLGSFIFKNIFVGVMVNNFQNIRREVTEDANELAANAKLAIELNIFGLDEGDKKKNINKDNLMDWEENVFHDLEIVRALGSGMTPTLWPRDTLFQYYILLETIANNLDEREQLLKLLNQSLLRNYDP